MKKANESFLLINPDIVIKDIENERILFNPKTNSIQVINEIGRFIWESCNKKISESGLIELIRENYEGADPGKIKKEVKVFLDKLTKLNLIQAIKK